MGIIAGIVLIGGVAVGGVAVGQFFLTPSDMSDSQIYQSVERKEEVALLALGIQGIARENEDGRILGVRLPAGDRTTLIQYDFTAKVGIDGEDVEVDQAGLAESAFVISIPEFIFIGYDDPHFEDPIESNGPLSFISEEIEETDMINSILSEEKQQSYIDDHLELLRDQARDYYTAIVRSIDPDAEVEFEFAE
ncbi:hypothetical protein A8L33_07915 [Microbacterium aurantiacum]|uniref:DUF4230 domain-containing protein n=2 Tax=Microbacterium aurantiacum TaxID=162393 RepID=A0A0M9VLD1_9MICO|nr:hypothetical protein A8L33_07915 [Microbacterium chocolatum]KOS11059.1 hypothetical protein XI38_07245 [Microbacterium chocolatum]